MSDKIFDETIGLLFENQTICPLGKYSREGIREFYEDIRELLFFCVYHPGEETKKAKDVLLRAEEKFPFVSKESKLQKSITFHDFLSYLPQIKRDLEEDVEAIYQGDPACDSLAEVILAYPGFIAISAYRIAHVLYELGFSFPARVITEYAHSRTGIDIHPGASIGSRFFIDHGTGIVIGETTIIGKGVKLYQGVTLGGISLKEGRALRGKKRHPTIEDNVTIYAGASILGGDTIIGHDSVIGSNVFLLESVPPFSMVKMKTGDIEIKPLKKE